MTEHDKQFMMAFLKRISHKLMCGGYGDEAERADYLINKLESYVPPEAALMADVLRVIFWNTDENGDPVGAQPESQWEEGYAAGIRYVYRVMKGRGVPLPQESGK